MNHSDLHRFACESIREGFRNHAFHFEIFREGEKFRSLYQIACDSLASMLESPETQARISVYLAANGENKTVQAIASQGKTLVLEGLLALANSQAK